MNQAINNSKEVSSNAVNIQHIKRATYMINNNYKKIYNKTGVIHKRHL